MLAWAQAPDSIPAADSAIEDNLLADIRGQRIGRHTLETLDLPADFLRRVRDRMLCDLYRRDIRRIDAPLDPGTSPHVSETSRPASQPAIRLIRHQPPDDLLAQRRAMPAIRPEARGFFVDVSGARFAASVNSGLTLPADLADEWRPAADIVAVRLARDGLMSTLVQVMRRIGPQAFRSDPAAALRRLGEIGFPVDMLAHFTRGAALSPAEMVRDLAERAATASTDLQANALAVEYAFSYRKQHGFIAADESGARAATLLRIQVPAQTLQEGPGSGDLLDAVEQMRARSPMDALLSVHARDAGALMARLATWSDGGEMTLIQEPLPVAQWAQDNGKPGWMRGRDGAPLATLTPRYASQNEDGSVFAPNESFMAAGWAQAGHTVVRSPLVFQGGNLLVIDDRARRRRVLLIGEAEIYRNTALGLSRAEVEQAFAAEFTVDECLVVPTVSFHIDLDVMPRSLPTGEVILFVNDAQAAAREVIGIGLSALRRAMILDERGERELRAMLNASDWAGFESALERVLHLHKSGPDHYRASLAAAFGDPHDIGTANLRRFLTALDIVMCAEPRLIESTSSAYTRAYRRALRRLLNENEALLAALSLSGWRVIAVPGLSAGDDSINYLNGVQEPARCFAPVYGGLYHELDERATTRIQRELGEQISVVPIRSAALQRRAGGLHCVASMYRRHE